MTQFVRPSMLPNQKEEVWILRKKGKFISAIERTVDKPPWSIFTFLKLYGGIEPRERYRSKRVLNLFERKEISRGTASELSIYTIAKKLKRAPSTIYREINRNGGLKKYREIKADKKAWDKDKRSKISYLAKNNLLRNIIKQKTLEKWSPKQISSCLKKSFPNSKKMNISHETIYKSLFIQAKGVSKKELTRHIRSKRVMRQRKQGNVEKSNRSQIIYAVSISVRPAGIEDRAIHGHWEEDLISGSKDTHIAILVER